MITKDNLTSVMNALTKEEIKTAIDSPGDMLSLTVNGYGHASLEPFEGETEEELEEVLSTGGCILDKDDFLRLFKESDSTNPFLIELI